MKEFYESPLCSRYASEQMQRLFSPDERYHIWRRLWVALARAEHELGLAVSAQQVAELAAHAGDEIDYQLIAAKEKELRHDVMAHIYAYGEACPAARGVIHLGATSCYVTDNADLIIYRQALLMVRNKLTVAMRNLAGFADRYRKTPCLGYTHGQPAQLVTVGKRACLWLQDLERCREELDHVVGTLRFLGCRGTTGTEASFMSLFHGDEAKIDEMNRLIAAEFGFDRLFAVTGQTYPRLEDSRIMNVLSLIAQSAYRCAGDIRLLAHMNQIDEPFESTQVGSSAMAYKRNPMRSERICSLARYVITDAMNAPLTAASQWLERSLDDSANRRISLPEGFLAIDAILKLLINVTGGLVVNEQVVEAAVRRYLPFIATENLLMQAVAKGGDRQAQHEIIRRLSHEQTARVKAGESCLLLEALAEDPEFLLDEAEIRELIRPHDFIGRAPKQVTAYLTALDLTGGEDDDSELNV